MSYDDDATLPSFRGGVGDVFFTLMRIGVTRESARRFVTVSGDKTLANELRRLIRDVIASNSMKKVQKTTKKEKKEKKPAEEEEEDALETSWKLFTKPQRAKLRNHVAELKRAWLMMRFNTMRTRKEYGAIRRMSVFEIETVFDVDAFYLMNFQEFNFTSLLELERTFDELQHRTKPSAKQYGLMVRLLSIRQTSAKRSRRSAANEPDESGGMAEDAMYDALRAAGSGRDFIRESNLNEYVPYNARYRSHPAYREEDDELEDDYALVPVSTLMRREKETLELTSDSSPSSKNKKKKKGKKKKNDEEEDDDDEEDEEEDEDENRAVRESRRLAECYARHRNSFLLENGFFYQREAVLIEKDIAQWTIGMFKDVTI